MSDGFARSARTTMLGLLLLGGTSMFAKAQSSMPDSPAAIWKTTTHNKDEHGPLRSRWNVEFVAGSQHFVVNPNLTLRRDEWNGMRVAYNQVNPTLIASYAFHSTNRNDLSIFAGHSNGTSEGFKTNMAGGQWRHYYGARNRVFTDIDLGAATYEDHIEKEIRVENGEDVIHPHPADGNAIILPFYRLKGGYNFINNEAIRVALVGSYTYKPGGLNIATGGIAIGFGRNFNPNFLSHHKNKKPVENYANNILDIGGQDAITQPKPGNHVYNIPQ
jgi:hypothetical protein